MVQTEIVALILTGIGIIVSILYYTVTLRNANKTQQHQLETRQAQLFMQIFSMWNNKDFWRDYIDLMKEDDPTPDQYYTRFDDPEKLAQWLHVGTLFEGIGSLLHKGFINPVIVSDMLTSMSMEYWEKTKPIILEARKKNPKNSEYVEYLAKELEKYKDSIRPELS